MTTNRTSRKMLQRDIPARFWLALAAFVSLAASVSLVAITSFEVSAQQSNNPAAGSVAPDAAFPMLPAQPDAAEATRNDLARIAEKTGAAPAGSALIDKSTLRPDALTLPEPPEVIANFDDIVREKPIALALPALPEVTLSADAQAGPQESQQSQGSVIRSAGADEMKLDLPSPPDVVVSLEPSPATKAFLRLDLDAAKLRAALEVPRNKFRFKPSEIDSFVEAYSARDFRPYWLEERNADVTVSPRVEGLVAALAGADKDGLDPARLAAALPSQRKGLVTPDRRTEIDLQFSVAAFLYARDARGGRLEPSRISALMTPSLEIPAPHDVLGKLARADRAATQSVLESYQPKHAGYRALRTALAKLREELAEPVLTGSVAGMDGAPHPSGNFPANWMEGGPLAFDKADPRVSVLRLRLNLPVSASNIYDQELREAVKAFQRANELSPNARITPKTRAALESPQAPLTLADRKPDRHALVKTILANMERWRWMPADLGKLHVFVNVADFQLKLVADSKVVHQTRVIVGKPQTQTPIFSDEMEHLIVNPSWGVPASIIKKEFLPKMAADPDYAAKRGYQVVRNGKSISIRQPPGERNALGFIKFIFPNHHSVYLHDTPNRNLFANEVRAFSHGCVRVEKPFAFAEKLLATSLGYTEPQLRAMIGRGERMLKLTEKIPVHLTYFTAFVDETGAIQQRRDMYGHDARVLGALHL